MRHATTTIADALAAAITEQRATVAKRFARVLKGDRKAVHRARVASRRLREALMVATTVGAPGDVARLRREVRRVTRAFGPVREIDVMLEELDLALTRHAWPPDRVAALHRWLEEERERRRADLSAKLAGVDRSWLRDRSETAASKIAAEVTPSEWWRALASHVVDRVDVVTAAIDECGTLYAPDRLHRLRIAIKKLRYAAEFLGDQSRLDVRRASSKLTHAQERFGHLHDVQVLLAQVQGMATGVRRSSFMAGFRVMADGLERDCREIHAGLLPYLPALRQSVLALRSDLVARLRSKRMPMAKASVASARKPGHGAVRRIRRAASR